MSEEILDQLAADMKMLLSEPVGSRRIKITDLTPRDGQQCKLATRVTTDDLLPLCASIDHEYLRNKFSDCTIAAFTP
jgi:2-oxoglutarate carboxylase large subunit